jgi:hypothetical protein
MFDMTTLFASLQTFLQGIIDAILQIFQNILPGLGG